MDNIIIVFSLIIILGGACFYIFKEKKKGKKCIGCPYSGGCGSCKGCQSSSHSSH